MALQLAGEGVLLGVAGLGASDGEGEIVVGHHVGSSGVEGGNRFYLNGYIAHGSEVDVLVDKFCVVALLGTSTLKIPLFFTPLRGILAKG